MLKKDKLRYNEYYDMQSVFDELYQQSRNNNNFYKLMEVIGSKQNIRLAYRNLKKNSGSRTKGTDGKTIEDVSSLTDEKLIETVRQMLEDYHPLPVRRVFIPKPGSDKMRPLGIPTIWDRLIQQCILQVMEPVCEPKFHNHSYGFRPNRSAHHAVSRMVTLINMGKHYYCVDIDIKGFFDNVDHGKLMKQIWNLGIRDKRLLCIISKLLKCEIEGEGIPVKGTPQGGILSPLLSSIVLNELDWWVSDQWETYKPERAKSKGFFGYAKKYTNLKDGYIVRYADDFKIMCRTYPEAKRYYHAVVDFLWNRLRLEISPEKSKVTNLKKNSTDFLGFKVKAVPKGTSKHGYVAKTDMSDKAVKKSKANLKKKILEIQNHTVAGSVKKYNSAVKGIQNYYCIATNIYNNLTEVDYALLRTRANRLKDKAKLIQFSDTPVKFRRLTKGIKDQKIIYRIMGVHMLPITGVHHKYPLNFSQDICNYTEKGRQRIHNNQHAVGRAKLKAFQMTLNPKESVEFRDNLISKYIAQYGKCHISGQLLEPDDAVGIRIKPKERNGSDGYGNLVIVNKSLLPVIEGIIDYCPVILTEKQKEKVNRLRRARKLKPVN